MIDFEPLNAKKAPVEPQNWQKYQKKFDFGGRNSVL
jgi:hypothetical protein